MISRDFVLSKDKLTLLDYNLDLKSALEFIEDGNFLSLPVVDGETFVGFASKDKVYKALVENPNTILKVKDIIRKDTAILKLEDDTERAAYLLSETNTPFVAVNDESEKFLGIITHKTIFKHYVEIFGLNEGHKIVINTYDIKGRLALLTDIISKAEGNIRSLVIDNPHVSTNVIKIIIRVQTDRIDEIKASIENAGFSIRQ